MKRASFACLFLGLTTTLLWSQANPVPLINQTASVASPTVVSSGVASPDVVASSVVSPSPIKASQADPKAQARILDGYGKLPLSFEANQGQADARVKFLSRTGGYTLFLTSDEDGIFPPELCEKVHQNVPGSRFERVSAAGHSTYFERPDVFNRDVGAFLKEHRP